MPNSHLLFLRKEQLGRSLVKQVAGTRRVRREGRDGPLKQLGFGLEAQTN
jgi:hypothetical protein